MRLLKYLILLSSTVTLGVIARTGTSSSDKSVNTSKKLQIAACSAGEVRKTCRSKCEPTCFSSSKCSTVCTSIPVCVCQDGFVRHEGICIPQPACQFFARAVKKSHKRSSSKPKKIKPTTKKPQKRKPTTPKTTLATAPPEIIVKPDHPPPSCGKGQAFTLCVCDATCEKGKVCKSCKSGCGCFRHFVRNSHGQCVAFEECPLPRSPFKPVAIIAEEKTGGIRIEGSRTFLLSPERFGSRMHHFGSRSEASRTINIKSFRHARSNHTFNRDTLIDKKSQRHFFTSSVLSNPVLFRGFSELRPTTTARPLSTKIIFSDVLGALHRNSTGTFAHVTQTPIIKPPAFGFSRRHHHQNEKFRHQSDRSRHQNEKAHLRRHHSSRPSSALTMRIVKRDKNPSLAFIPNNESDDQKKQDFKFSKDLSIPLEPPRELINKPTKADRPLLSDTPSNNIVHENKFGPVPPPRVKKLKEKLRGLPPGIAPPTDFGPPAMTPFLFFREQRIHRRQQKLQKLKSEMPWLATAMERVK